MAQVDAALAARIAANVARDRKFAELERAERVLTKQLRGALMALLGRRR
jgi:hypothetical protein